MSRAQTYRQNAPLGKPGQIIKGIARGTQILFGGIIAILLGVTLGKAWHYTTGWHHLWGFSCVIASASTFTAMALCSNTIQSYCYFFADGFFLTMWAIVAGIFGSVYFPFPKQELPLNKGTTGPSLTTMRAVSVLNLMVMMAWVCTFALSIWHFMKVKKSVKSGPNSAPTTSRHGAPPAKRRALPTTPIRRPPCAAPRPALEINRNTPLTPSAGVSKTNQQLLGEFVLMSITEVAALDPTELQRKAKGIKALASFAGKVSNPDLIGRFMEWQNTMLELERGEAGAGEEADTPSQATPSQGNTPSGRRKIQGNTDEELLDTFVFKSMQELKNMLAADLRDLIRGVEALRQYFNGVNKGGMIKYYMEWQMGMVAMKQEREEDEDEDEDEEDEDEEEVEDEEAKEDEEEEEEDEYEEAKEGKEEEVVTKAVAARKAPVVIDLVSDSEDEESGGTMNSVGRVASRKQEMRMVEV
ncbi:hypothetical protein Vi05172_g11359 [Venturia inaequalis]|nr:hypothetical protein Vi05172_g11359 [Venturia inaequalis]